MVAFAVGFSTPLSSAFPKRLKWYVRGSRVRKASGILHLSVEQAFDGVNERHLGLGCSFHLLCCLPQCSLARLRRSTWEGRGGDRRAKPWVTTKTQHLAGQADICEQACVAQGKRSGEVTGGWVEICIYFYFLLHCHCPSRM